MVATTLCTMPVWHLSLFIWSFLALHEFALSESPISGEGDGSSDSTTSYSVSTIIPYAVGQIIAARAETNSKVWNSTVLRGRNSTLGLESIIWRHGKPNSKSDTSNKITSSPGPSSAPMQRIDSETEARAEPSSAANTEAPSRTTSADYDSWKPYSTWVPGPGEFFTPETTPTTQSPKTTRGTSTSRDSMITLSNSSSDQSATSNSNNKRLISASDSAVFPSSTSTEKSPQFATRAAQTSNPLIDAALNLLSVSTERFDPASLTPLRNAAALLREPLLKKSPAVQTVTARPPGTRPTANRRQRPRPNPTRRRTQLSSIRPKVNGTFAIGQVATQRPISNMNRPLLLGNDTEKVITDENRRLTGLNSSLSLTPMGSGMDGEGAVKPTVFEEVTPAQTKIAESIPQIPAINLITNGNLPTSERPVLNGVGVKTQSEVISNVLMKTPTSQTATAELMTQRPIINIVTTRNPLVRTSTNPSSERPMLNVPIVEPATQVSSSQTTGESILQIPAINFITTRNPLTRTSTNSSSERPKLNVAEIEAPSEAILNLLKKTSPSQTTGQSILEIPAINFITTRNPLIRTPANSPSERPALSVEAPGVTISNVLKKTSPSQTTRITPIPVINFFTTRNPLIRTPTNPPSEQPIFNTADIETSSETVTNLLKKISQLQTTTEESITKIPAINFLTTPNPTIRTSTKTSSERTTVNGFGVETLSEPIPIIFEEEIPQIKEKQKPVFNTTITRNPVIITQTKSASERPLLNMIKIGAPSEANPTDYGESSLTQIKTAELKPNMPEINFLTTKNPMTRISAKPSSERPVFEDFGGEAANLPTKSTQTTVTPFNVQDIYELIRNQVAASATVVDPEPPAPVDVYNVIFQSLLSSAKTRRGNSTITNVNQVATTEAPKIGSLITTAARRRPPIQFITQSPYRTTLQRLTSPRPTSSRPTFTVHKPKEPQTLSLPKEAEWYLPPPVPTLSVGKETPPDLIVYTPEATDFDSESEDVVAENSHLKMKDGSIVLFLANSLKSSPLPVDQIEKHDPYDDYDETADHLIQPFTHQPPTMRVFPELKKDRTESVTEATTTTPPTTKSRVSVIYPTASKKRPTFHHVEMPLMGGHFGMKFTAPINLRTNFPVPADILEKYKDDETISAVLKNMHPPTAGQAEARTPATTTSSPTTSTTPSSTVATTTPSPLSRELPEQTTAATKAPETKIGPVPLSSVTSFPMVLLTSLLIPAAIGIFSLSSPTERQGFGSRYDSWEDYPSDRHGYGYDPYGAYDSYEYNPDRLNDYHWSDNYDDWYRRKDRQDVQKIPFGAVSSFAMMLLPAFTLLYLINGAGKKLSRSMPPALDLLKEISHLIDTFPYQDWFM